MGAVLTPAGSLLAGVESEGVLDTVGSAFILWPPPSPGVSTTPVPGTTVPSGIASPSPLEMALADRLNVGPAVVGFRMSLAEIVSSGGLRFGIPECAAMAKFGEPLSKAVGIFITALLWCVFWYACSFRIRAAASALAEGMGMPIAFSCSLACVARGESG